MGCGESHLFNTTASATSYLGCALHEMHVSISTQRATTTQKQTRQDGHKDRQIAETQRERERVMSVTLDNL